MAESDFQNDEPAHHGAGLRLRRAREAAGLSLGDIAARTKIAERHLASIEQSRFKALASRTYAVGFARAYARAVGLDEGQVAQAVRDELSASDTTREAPQVDVFEPGDPARVPGSRVAWAAALFAVAVLGFVFVYWRSFFSPAVPLPELTVPEATASATAPASSGLALPAQKALVVFTALEPDIWVKFYDAAGNQLMQKQMAKGESYTVPAAATQPLIRTARPDALQVTVGGRIVPPLADKPVSLKDVPVSAAALLARAVPAPPKPPAATPAPQPAASAQPVAAPAPASRPAAAASGPVERQPEPASPAPAITPSAAPPPPAAVSLAPAGEAGASTVSN